MELPKYLNPSIVVVVIALYVVIHYVPRNAKSPTRRLPPEAGGAWPIVGHLHIFSGSTLPHIVLGDMADKYGPAFTIRIGVHRGLVVSDWKLAKQLTTAHDVHISSRPKSRAAKHLGYNNFMLAFTPYGPYWHDIRKLISTELLSNRRLEQLKHIRVAEVETSVKELYKLWTENKNSDPSGHVLVEMKKWFGDLTLNMVLQMVVGKRIFGMATDCDEKEGRLCQRVLRDFVKFLGVFVPADALPFLGWLDIGGHEKAMKKVAKEMDSLVDEWLQEHRRMKEGDGSTVCEGEKDFMDAMLSRIEGIDLNGCSADTAIKATCMMAQEELDMVVGKERKVNELDINNLIYLQAIVKETLRMYPAAPLGGPRIFTEDCTIYGFHVPKETWLFFNMQKLQRDPQVWSSPHEFKPERFINCHKEVDVFGRNFELIPFGIGRRICPGTTFSLQMLHLILANLLHSFELSNASHIGIDMTETVGLSNLKGTPLEIRLAPRLSAHLSGGA